MKLSSYLLIALFTLASCGHHHHKKHSHAGHENHHKEQAHHHNQNTDGLSLNDGKKWTTDADLRKQMEKINAAVQKVKKLEKSGKAGPKTYKGLYKGLQATTQTIINTCKMPEWMHENYHVILEDILNTSEELKDTHKQMEVTGKLTRTLRKYTEYFDHDLKVD